MHILLILLTACLPTLASAATVRADSFGFDPVDATTALQAAFDDPADTVIVPRMASAWITGPLRIRRSGKTIIFESGVELVAKAGYGIYDCLIDATRCDDLTIRGYGATLRMPKAEYTTGEWRHCLAIRACRRVSISGLTLRDSGGDGLYLDGDGTDGSYASDITVRDCIMDNNRRQGVSIISAEKVLLEGCQMLNTVGTNPMAGIDFEPDNASQRLVDITLRRCAFAGNSSCGILFYPRALGAGSRPISIAIEDCLVSSTGSDSHGSGIALLSAPDSGPDGTMLTVSRCLMEDVKGPGLQITSSAANSQVVISDCVLRNVGFGHIESWNSAIMMTDEPDFPIRLYGNVRFASNLVVFNQRRHFLRATEEADSQGCTAVSGDITVVNQFGVTSDFGAKATDITLVVNALAALPAQQVSLSVLAADAVKGGPSARIRVSRTTSDAFPCAVRLQLTGTARNGVDYAYQPGFAIIPAGQNQVEVAIPAIATGVREAAKPFTVEIAPSPGNYSGTGSAVLQVVDLIPSTNQAPTATPGQATTAEDTAVVITLAGVDADGTITGYTIVSEPTHGTLTGSGAIWTYTPASGFTGTDHLTFTVTDDDGAVSAPAAIDITVAAANLPPSVTLTAPAASSTITLPAAVTLQATATDADGVIVRVEFLLDGITVSEDTSAPYAVVWNATAGSHLVAARAFDDRGASTTSAAVSILAVAASSPPASGDSSGAGASRSCGFGSGFTLLAGLMAIGLGRCLRPR